jgi:putative NIF3 family GTP cyclohydrolase 1 type 2
MTDITGLQLIQRILAKTGATGRGDTVDHVSAGDPARFVSGVAVMAMASLAGLKAAAAAGRSMVVTYDPAFWSGNDDYNHLEVNSLFAEKRDFVRAHDMLVFNLHDHWRDRMPDGIAAGMAQALGWQADAGNANFFRRPPGTLLVLAQELSAKLNDKTLRVVGDPKLPVSALATSFGNTAQMPGIALLNGPADVLVCGYAHEWEVVEYAQDMIAVGEKKGLILLGENASVGAGMSYCAEWLKAFITEVPVEFFPAPEPYWNP